MRLCVGLVLTLVLLAPAAGGAVTGPAVTEFALPTQGGLPSAIAAGPDGAMWFTEGGRPKIGRITKAGIVREFTSPLFIGSIPPVGITAGPDGAIWFTGGTIVGRISTTGAVTQFPVPFIAYGITTGSDGALWLAGVTPTPPERAPPVTVARLTTTGALTIYLAPALGDGLGITTGRDGALWFAENAPDKIGRITTTGKIAEFPLPTPFAFPVAIVNGPDGALWFTEQLAGKIGRITTSGTITEFRLPSAGSNPEGITAGPDGALWFTEDAGRIGRITTAGAITELPVPTASGIPMGIATGPDGAIWFTEQVGNRIGRVAVVPTSKTECKHGGWRTFGNLFKNQRACVRFLARHPRTRADLPGDT